MKELDMKLSKEVAKEAGEKVAKAKEELEHNKDSFNLFLRETISDSKEQARFQRKIIKVLSIILAIVSIVSICGFIGLGMYNQHLIKKMAQENTQQMMDFINSTEFYYDVELTNENSDFNYNNLISK